jgi:hypothetical protein
MNFKAEHSSIYTTFAWKNSKNQTFCEKSWSVTFFMERIEWKCWWEHWQRSVGRNIGEHLEMKFTKTVRFISVPQYSCSRQGSLATLLINSGAHSSIRMKILRAWKTSSEEERHGIEKGCAKFYRALRYPGHTQTNSHSCWPFCLSRNRNLTLRNHLKVRCRVSDSMQ